MVGNAFGGSTTVASKQNAHRVRPAPRYGAPDAASWRRDALWPVASAALAVLVCVGTGLVPLPPSLLVLAALLVVLACLALLPLLRVWPGVLAGAGVAGICVAVGWSQGRMLALPLLALFTGHYTYLARRAAKGEVAAARNGGTALQDEVRRLASDLKNQGKLDAAFDKLVQLPVRGEVLRDLYHLGKAFERNRSFEGARGVFAHLVAHAPLYRDAGARLGRAERLAEVERQAKGPSSARPQAAGAFAAPQHLGRYEIDGELGRGSMGRVYAAHDPVIGRAVALKTLALGSEFEGAALVDARARFFREAESAGRLQHPQIVAIYDAGDEQGLSWIAMERLRGKDLSHAVQPEHWLAVPILLSIAARVADALDYAHQHQVVHRDIKPSNILYDAGTDTVKVTDFGIARITDNSKTRTGLVLGTPSFMAPEQIVGTKADGRCDIYALGVTLYQLLTGSLPLRGESMSALMHAIANEVPADVRTLRADLPESVAMVVARALHKNPGARFQTGAQMAAALREASSGMRPSADAHFGAPLDYDARTDFHKYPMADFPDTVFDSAAAPAAPHATRSRI
ncbi:serine/threonine protein kinase [Simplicispira hankyongi]|uniref:non-specific serine/threonine protein kinase n=1 Tax=Simplicispira hankyongi TaxID=2315688 RepID=A0A398C656_9BURK|nr:serine/threonine protein kinase [Simplicispira hankyongi]